MLARLLHLANSSPPPEFRKEFYALKDRLLTKHGEHIGFDVQHIEGKICFGCDGSGIYYHYYSGDEDICGRCCGSGWWKHPKWVVLNKYVWRGYKFHIPGEVSYEKPEPDVSNIHGYVEHTNYGSKSDTAFANLCLLCGEWRLLFRWLLASHKVKWRHHPWFVLQMVVCRSGRKIRDWSVRCECGRRTWDRYLRRCNSCTSKIREQQADLPF